MTYTIRAKNIENAERERRLTEALEGYQSGRFKSYREAAKALNVSHTTLNYRAHGRKPRSQAHQNVQILSAKEEWELVRWITHLTFISDPPKRHTIKEMATTIRKRRTQGIIDPFASYAQHEEIGEQWVPRFLQRHPELVVIMSE